METKQELLKQLSEAQGQLEELKKKIENYQEPKFEVGKWYWIERPLYMEKRALINYQGNISYGFSHFGNWSSGYCFSKEDVAGYNITPATKEEVEEALIKEAKKRGYDRPDIRFKCLSGWSDRPNCWSQWKNKNGKIKIETDYCVIVEGVHDFILCVFKDGKWAEIVKEENIEVCGYEVVREVNGFKIGCKKIFTPQIISLKEFMQENNFKEVSFDGYTVSLETIEKILKLKNK